MCPPARDSKQAAPGNQPYDRKPVGRFAPSPTGDLHFGSLGAAVGSFLHARASGGSWLIRIEDIDPPREVKGAAERQLHTLARFGLVPDQPAQRQSLNQARHQTAIQRLLDAGKAFRCACSRRELPASGVYPGTCRDGLPPDRPGRSIRLRVDDEQVCFSDLACGEQTQRPSRQSGDFVIRRADGLVAYQLAVVVDDAADAVTQVVRGRDLLDSTGRQILLHRALNLTPPSYLHLPLILDPSGRKLSKSLGDDPVSRQKPEQALRLALQVLGHAPPDEVLSLDACWRWAVKHWNPARIPDVPVTVQGGRVERYTPR